MRNWVLGFGKSFWEYANSNLGSVLIGATTAYMYTKGSHEAALDETRRLLIESQNDNQAIKTQLLQQEERVKNLANSWIGTQAQHNETREKLLRCENNFGLLKYAYNNTSMCLFKQQYTEKPDDEKPTVTHNLKKS